MANWTEMINVTEMGPQLPPPLVISATYKAVGAMICFFILLVGLFGNVLVVIVIARSKSMRTPTNCYLVNLSVADTMVLLSATLPFSVGLLFKYTSDWPYGKPLCAICTYGNYTGINASALLITAFTIERNIAICHPMKAHYICTVKRAIKIIAGIWIFSIIYNGFWLFTTQVVIIRYSDGGYIEHCQLDPMIAKTITQVTVTLDMTLFYCVPLTIVTVLHCRVAQVLRKKSGLPSYKGTRAPCSADRHQSGGAESSRSRSQVVKMLVTIVIAFALARIPYRAALVKTLFQANPDVVFDEWYFLFARLPIFANSAINPIIYNLMSVKFRREFRKQVCCWVSPKFPAILTSLRSSLTTHSHRTKATTDSNETTV